MKREERRVHEPHSHVKTNWFESLLDLLLADSMNPWSQKKQSHTRDLSCSGTRTHLDFCNYSV